MPSHVLVTPNNSDHTFLSDCVWCCKETLCFGGYLGGGCTECGLRWGEPGELQENVIRKYKEREGLTWNEFADRYGWKGGTLRRYLGYERCLPVYEDVLRIRKEEEGVDF